MARKSASASELVTVALMVSISLPGCTGAGKPGTGGLGGRLLSALGIGRAKVAQKATSGDGSEQGGRKGRMNAELLRELYEVVLLRPVQDKAEFGNFVDSMNQGASLEGLYNGFIHSSGYRKYEAGTGTASERALRTFAEELANLELALPTPTEFGPGAAKPLEILSANELTEAPAGAPAPAPAGALDEKALVDNYLKAFQGASVYTLKRVLGDEALKVIAAKRRQPQDLSAWYGKWVIRLAGRGVDFGLALRNKSDESFHTAWVKTASEDALTWEVLNRLHRVMNATYTSASPEGK